MTADINVSIEYVAARRVLLDALVLFGDQIDAFVLVGAQAVYYHAPVGDRRPMFTTDGDLAIDPQLLSDRPDLGLTLERAGFARDPKGNPGRWTSPDGIPIDLMVPSGVLPRSSRRTAHLDGHDRATARRTRGLELALHDNSIVSLGALDPTDDRCVELRVAGPAALVLAKTVKIRERIDAQRVGRVSSKDAGDLLRLLRNVPPKTIGDAFVKHAADDTLRTDIVDALRWLGSNASDSRRRTALLMLVADDASGSESPTDVQRAFSILIQRMLDAASTLM